MTKEEIASRAERFCNEFHITEYPVNIVKLCGQQGISVFEEYLPENVSGYIVVKKENFEEYNHNKIIVTNLSDLATRRRFTIAHELAHYLLHRKEDTSLYAHRDAGQNDGIEKEANFFASYILMPPDLIEEATSQKGDLWKQFSLDAKVQYIAEKFAVSRAAAEIRLKELKLL